MTFVVCENMGTYFLGYLSIGMAILISLLDIDNLFSSKKELIVGCIVIGIFLLIGVVDLAHCRNSYYIVDDIKISKIFIGKKYEHEWKNITVSMGRFDALVLNDKRNNKRIVIPKNRHNYRKLGDFIKDKFSIK